MSHRKTSAEKTLARLVEILRRLNEGERIDPKALVSEFGVNLRTVQRELAKARALLAEML